jgi:hypothetical protein
MSEQENDMVHRTTESASAPIGHPSVAAVSPREALGLELAAQGNPVGAAKFLDWVERELQMMIVTSAMPAPVQQRLRDVYREVWASAEYIRGFAAANSTVA